MSKEEWIWMPHPDHLCIADSCRFRLATYVNGHVVSTVGEYFPDRDVRRYILQSRLSSGFESEEEKGKIRLVLSKIGDDFNRYYLQMFGWDDIGWEIKDDEKKEWKIKDLPQAALEEFKNFSGVIKICSPENGYE